MQLRKGYREISYLLTNFRRSVTQRWIAEMCFWTFIAKSAMLGAFPVGVPICINSSHKITLTMFAIK